MIKFKTMRTALFFTCLLFLSVNTTAFAVNVRWTATGGPFGQRPGFPVDVKVDQHNSANIFVLWESTAGTGNDKFILLQSTDGGNTWTDKEESTNAWVVEVDDGSGGPATMYCKMFGLRMDPDNFSHIYAFGGDVASAKGGIWYSTDGGDTWAQIYGGGKDSDGFLGIPGAITTALEIAPSDHQVIYRGVAANFTNIYNPAVLGHVISVSDDGGATWTDISTYEGLPFQFGVRAMAIDPSDDKKLAVSMVVNADFLKGGYTAGIYMSTDEGNSFQLSLEDPIGYIHAVPGDVYPLYSAIQYDVRDPGRLRVIKNAGYVRSDISPFYPSLYTTPEVFLSDDWGATWASFETNGIYPNEGNIPNLGPFSIADPNDFNRLFYLQYHSWRSSDGGSHWAQLDDRFSVVEFCSSEPSLVIGAYNYSGAHLLMRSTNQGVNWTDMSSDIRRIASSSTVAPNPIIAGMVFSNAFGLWRTSDWGLTWTDLTNVPSAMRFAFDLQDLGVIYGTVGRDLYRATDNLSTLGDPVFSLPSITYEVLGNVAVSPKDSSVVYINVTTGVEPRLMKSLDSGESFATIGPTGSTEVPAILVIDPVTPEIVYKSMNNPPRGIWKSIDGGGSWADVTHGVTDLTTITAIAINPRTPDVVYVASRTIGAPIYVTRDGAASWTSTGNSNVPNSFGIRISIDPLRPQRVYAIFSPSISGIGATICRRIDGVDTSWTPISYAGSGIENRRYRGIAVDAITDAILYAATDNGVYKGIDYDGIPTPEIDSVSPYFAAPATSLRIDGNYFIRSPLTVTIRGPQENPTQRDISSTSSFTPVRIDSNLPAGLPPGTYEAWVTAAGGISNHATFEVVGPSPFGPTIEAVMFDNRFYSGPSQPISPAPNVKANILSSTGINPNGFEYVLINKATSDWRRATLESSVYTPMSSVSGELEFNVSPKIDSGRYDFRIIAHSNATNDAYADGYTGEWTGSVEVGVGNVKIIGNVMSYPVPYKPLSSSALRIAYTLNQDADVVVFVYDISGQVLLTKKFPAGVSGGHAGYNEFSWNGRTDFGNVIANGMYVIKVVTKNRMLKSGFIVVLD